MHCSNSSAQGTLHFLRWGQSAFANFAVVPPDTGIVHQVNLEFLARVVFANEQGLAYPDTLVGTDSHTTMINGVGVLGWGVGGIEAEAAMLGQPSTMLIPEVIGVKFSGRLAEGATATDLVLTVTELLRKRGVVEKFVEFFGDGLAGLPLADRATIANMAPEYGATCGIFPIDEVTLDYLRLTGRPEDQIALVRAYAQAQGAGATTARRTPPIPVAAPRTVDGSSLRSPARSGRGRVSLVGHAKGLSRAFARDQDKWKIDGHGARQGRFGRSLNSRTDAVVSPRSLLYQYLEPRRDIGCRTRRTETRDGAAFRCRPGQDFARAGSKVVHGLLKRSELTDDLEGIGFQPSATLHDCTVTPAPSTRPFRWRSPITSVGRVSTVWQPQFRGARTPGSSHEFPGVAAARRAYALAGTVDMISRATRSAAIRSGKPVYPARHLADRA